jgi:hypothetical protein
MSQYRARPPALATLLLDDAVVRITRWDRRDAGIEHNVVNAGDQPMSFIEIEYK